MTLELKADTATQESSYGHHIDWYLGFLDYICMDLALESSLAVVLQCDATGLLSGVETL